MDKIGNTIGQRVRECREQIGLTQFQFAEMLEVRQDYLSKIENDLIDLSFCMLEKLYQNNFDVDYIVTGHSCVEIQEANRIKELEINYSTGFKKFWCYFMKNQEMDRFTLIDPCIQKEILAFLEMEQKENASLIFYLRKTTNSSQEKMADSLNVGPKTYRNLEYGKTLPGANIMNKLFELGYCWPSFFLNQEWHMDYIIQLFLRSKGEKIAKEIIKNANNIVEWI